MERNWLVGIPTFKRPSLLSAALSSLVKQRDAPDFTVFVADNDPKGSARAVSARYSDSLRIKYGCESRPGVSHVRNLILSEADEYELLALLDDDQEAPETWLAEMAAAARKFPDSVIVGPVNFDLQQARREDPLVEIAFGRKQKPRGAKLMETGAGNCLLPMKEIEKRCPRIVFDAKFSHTGGEDTKFFRELSSAGIEIRWWPEAHVSETVSEDRSTKNETAQRFVRAGYINGVLRLEKSSRLTVLFGAILRISAGCIMMLKGDRSTTGVNGRVRYLGGRGALKAALNRDMNYYGTGVGR